MTFKSQVYTRITIAVWIGLMVLGVMALTNQTKGESNTTAHTVTTSGPTAG